jgi:hypothetical protein
MKIKIFDTPGARVRLLKAKVHPKVIDAICGLTLDAQDVAGRLAVTVNGADWILPAESFEEVKP